MMDILGFLSCKHCEYLWPSENYADHGRCQKSMQFHGHFQTQNVPTTVLPMQLSAKHVWCSYTMFMYAAVSPACILCVCYAVIGRNSWTILCSKERDCSLKNIVSWNNDDDCDLSSWKLKHLANIMEQMRLYEINWNWSEPCFFVIRIRILNPTEILR